MGRRFFFLIFALLLSWPVSSGENVCARITPDKEAINFISSFDIFKKAVSQFKSGKFASSFKEFVKAFGKLKSDAERLFQSKKCRQDELQKFLAKYTRGDKPLLKTGGDVFLFHPSFYQITAYASCMAKKPGEGLKILLEATIDSNWAELIEWIKVLQLESI